MPAINQRCPRSGKPVAHDSLARYRGWTVGFCNPGCRDDFAADPEDSPADRAYFDTLIRDQGLDAVPTLDTLEGERVTLRAFQADDFDALLAVFSDPVAMRWWSTPPFAGRADAEQYLEAIWRYAAAGTLHQRAIVRRDTGEVIGSTTIFAIDRGNRRAEIGYIVGSAHWGQGYGREAVACTLRHAFGPMRLHRIEADVDPANAASLRLLAALGFREEGRARQRWRVGGGVQDSVLLARLADDPPP